MVKETKEFVESILQRRPIKNLPQCFTDLPGATDAMREYVINDLDREIKRLTSLRYPSVLRDPLLHLESLDYYVSELLCFLSSTKRSALHYKPQSVLGWETI